MTKSTRVKFLQIHTLTIYPASLLNRDDAGWAKRMPFGGRIRTRISSQCLKRHWRTADGDHSLASLGAPMSVRSREIFDRLIAKPLIEEEGLKAERVHEVAAALRDEVFGGSKDKKSDDGKKKGRGADTASETASDGLAMNQVVVLGRPEIDFFKSIVKRLAEKPGGKAADAVTQFLKDEKKNLEALKKSAGGLDGAMFGRMVTSDHLARVDSAVQVAHSFTVHEEESESDYFTAVDDLRRAEGDLGSGHLNESELTSGLFYGYVVVDLPQLISNVEGVERSAWEKADPGVSARAVERLLHLIATVSPGAKRGSTAPFAYAQLMLVESGSRQPRSLAGAFHEPVAMHGDGGVLAAAERALTDHLSGFDAMYGGGEERQYIAMRAVDGLLAQRAKSLSELAAWVGRVVRGAKA